MFSEYQKHTYGGLILCQVWDTWGDRADPVPGLLEPTIAGRTQKQVFPHNSSKQRWKGSWNSYFPNAVYES